MPLFTAYLVKQDYKHVDRYYFDGQNVVEDAKSIFAQGVITSDNTTVTEYLRKNDTNIRRIYRSESPYDLYYRETDNPNPWWRDFWEVPESLRNKSTDVMVVLEIDRRLFVITHGHGRFILNPMAVEHDFGLRTALNLIDEKEIRALDIFNPSEIAMRTRKETGKKTDIEEYDINTLNSLLRTIAGSIVGEFRQFFTSVDGSDSIKFNYDGNVQGLSNVLVKLNGKYSSEEYREKGFRWIDNFRIVRDKDLVRILDDRLLAKLKIFSTDLILAFPNLPRSVVNAYFSYSGFGKRRSESLFPELDIETQYYDMLKTGNSDLSVDVLKRQHIHALEHDTSFEVASQSVYQCLYCEEVYEGKTYFLESGIWYVTDKSFLEDVDSKIQELSSSAWDFGLEYRKKELLQEAMKLSKSKEFVYNQQLEQHLRDTGHAELLDTKIINYKGQQIELCDVVFKDTVGKVFLIYNKYKYGSSALSHLFSQGSVSASLIIEREFREVANRKIRTRELQFSLDSLIRRDFTIVYGIISTRNRLGQHSLPLFSRVNLNMFHSAIEKLGFSVKLSYIDVV